MKSIQDILDNLKEKGFRITKARKGIVEILWISEAPISAEEIMENLKVNKTTVYRELDFLKSQNLLEEVRLGGSKKFFEGSFKDHHHHLYCLNCKKIEDVEMESDLDVMEEKIAATKNFQIQKHNLEFFGLCATCK